MTHCPDCWRILRKELRPKLVSSGQSVLRMKCPVCDQLFPSDQEEIEHEQQVKKKKEDANDAARRIDQWWKRLRGMGQSQPEHNTEDEIGDYSW